MNWEGALAMITGQVRRRLSLTAARANARLILDRVQVLGEGTEAAGCREEKDGSKAEGSPFGAHAGQSHPQERRHLPAVKPFSFSFYMIIGLIKVSTGGSLQL